jgi:selenocysteine-specific elongation factor
MIIGTAGHIDHGKTTLLQALTGVAGDHRREERERGITIDLGYRYADLGNGVLTGFIDVPGHERFVHNMLAGACGIDLLLLVVAADDGVMPQTREHLAIAELLGIGQALVALTKVDRVAPDRVAQVASDVRALLAPGPLAGAPVFPLNAATGDGVNALRQALLTQAARSRAGPEQGFRLAIDRVFSVAGAGVVVTGTAFSGQLSVGDQLLLAPAGRSVRVRGLRAQNAAAQTAHAGQRVAVNIAAERLGVEQVHRGDWLVAPLLDLPSTRVDIQLRLLPGERPLKHWTPVHVHLGAQDVTARVALLEGETLEPGATALAQLLLNAPAHAVHGDALVLRDQSAQRTLGGGRVLDPFAPARQRRSVQRLTQLRALCGASLEQALPTLLAEAPNGLEPERLERQFNRPRASWTLEASVLPVATRVGLRLFRREQWQRLGEQLINGLQRFHQGQPDELGPDRDRLRRYALPELERAVFLALLQAHLKNSTVQASGPWLHLPEHRVSLSPQDEALRVRVWPLLEQGGFDPPWVRDLSRATGCDEAEVRQLMRKLARLGLVQQVVKDLFYPEHTLRALAAAAETVAERDGTLRAATFRDRVSLGRKRSIQLLEHFDRVGLTRRLGDERRVRPDSALAQPQDLQA